MLNNSTDEKRKWKKEGIETHRTRFIILNAHKKRKTRNLYILACFQQINWKLSSERKRQRDDFRLFSRVRCLFAAAFGNECNYPYLWHCCLLFDSITKEPLTSQPVNPNVKNGNFLFVAVAFICCRATGMIITAAAVMAAAAAEINTTINYMRNDRCFLYWSERAKGTQNQ